MFTNTNLLTPNRVVKPPKILSLVEPTNLLQSDEILTDSHNNMSAPTNNQKYSNITTSSDEDEATGIADFKMVIIRSKDIVITEEFFPTILPIKKSLTIIHFAAAN